MSAEHDEGRRLVELIGMLSRAMAPERSDGVAEGETVLVVVCKVTLSSGGQGDNAGGVYSTKVVADFGASASDGQIVQALTIAPQAVEAELGQILSDAQQRRAEQRRGEG